VAKLSAIMPCSSFWGKFQTGISLNRTSKLPVILRYSPRFCSNFFDGWGWGRGKGCTWPNGSVRQWGCRCSGSLCTEICCTIVFQVMVLTPPVSLLFALLARRKDLHTGRTAYYMSFLNYPCRYGVSSSTLSGRRSSYTRHRIGHACFLTIDMYCFMSWNLFLHTFQALC
jgi:hypothetical protein